MIRTQLKYYLELRLLLFLLVSCLFQTHVDPLTPAYPRVTPISFHMTTTSKKIDTSDNKGDFPREEFQIPAPITVPGRKHADKSGSTDGEEQGRPLMPPPATYLATRKSTNDESVLVGATLAGVKESGVILPPHPRRKEEAGAGQDGGGGYVPPSWGLTTAPTSLGLSLTVLKGGTEVGSVSLDNQAYFLLGERSVFCEDSRGMMYGLAVRLKYSPRGSPMAHELERVGRSIYCSSLSSPLCSS